MVMMRAAAPSTYYLAPQSRTSPSWTPSSRTPPLLPIPLPTSLPHLLLPSTDRRADVPETKPTRGFRRVYGFVATLDDELRRDLDRERITDFVTTIRQDTDEICVLLNDAQSD
ncbi:hypothetical protein Tco_1388603, partial [Tanacetum coccineum]